MKSISHLDVQVFRAILLSSVDEVASRLSQDARAFDLGDVTIRCDVAFWMMTRIQLRHPM